VGQGLVWPNIFETVGELFKPNLWSMFRSVGGWLYFAGGMMGLTVLFLPEKRWGWHHFALLAGAFGAFLYIPLWTGLVDLPFIGTKPQTLRELSPWATVRLFLLPLAIAVLLRLFDKEIPEEIGPGAGLVLSIWVLGAFYLSYSGTRFFLLMAAPFGLAFGVVVGKLYQWIVDGLTRLIPGYRPLIQLVLFACLAWLLVSPVRDGYRVARRTLPEMNDAWWNTFAKIRDETRPDSIINLWWDYGYWAKYIAERRVTGDGGSLQTQVHHWMAKALSLRSEEKGLGILRMLNCGSEATPLPEGKKGAYGKVLKTGRNPMTAYTIVADLSTQTESEARAYLANNGFGPEEGREILQSTHCTPPDAFLVLSEELVRTARLWMRLGLWDPIKMKAIKRLELLPEGEAVELLMKAFQISRQRANWMYAQMSQLESDTQIRSFVAPRQRLLLRAWRRCRPGADPSSLVCRVGMRIGRNKSLLEFVTVDLSDPAKSRFKFRAGGGDDRPSEKPRIVILAGPTEKKEIEIAVSGKPELGVLVDVPNSQVLIGSPPLLRSLFVDLLFLEGRYTKRFTKFNETSSRLRGRVTTWRIDWESTNPAD
jgi:hypothetical protein